MVHRHRVTPFEWIDVGCFPRGLESIAHHAFAVRDASHRIILNCEAGYQFNRGPRLLFHRRFLGSDTIHACMLLPTTLAKQSNVSCECHDNSNSRNNITVRFMVSTAQQGFLYDLVTPICCNVVGIDDILATSSLIAQYTYQSDLVMAVTSAALDLLFALTQNGIYLEAICSIWSYGLHDFELVYRLWTGVEVYRLWTGAERSMSAHTIPRLLWQHNFGQSRPMQHMIVCGDTLVCLSVLVGVGVCTGRCWCLFR